MAWCRSEPIARSSASVRSATRCRISSLSIASSTRWRRRSCSSSWIAGIICPNSLGPPTDRKLFDRSLAGFDQRKKSSKPARGARPVQFMSRRHHAHQREDRDRQHHLLAERRHRQARCAGDEEEVDHLPQRSECDEPEQRLGQDANEAFHIERIGSI